MKVLAYGEIMLRLSTADYTRLEDTDNFDACYGGTESNVLVALSHLGDETSYISKVPNNALGEGVIRHLRKHNVGLEHLLVGGSTLGIYFLQPGFGSLPSKVIYHRKGAVVNTILEDDLCYDEIFNGVSWFHVTGISLAISENSKKVSIRLCKEAKKRGVKVSFDFNYRATLWTIDEAKVAFNEIMQYVDVCFGNQYDLKNLGIKGDSTKPDHGWSDMENWMISKGFISNGKLIAAHELSDNVNGNDGLTVTVLEFSKNTKISSGIRLAFSQNFKWPEDFFTKVNNYYTWYKSGDKIN